MARGRGKKQNEGGGDGGQQAAGPSGAGPPPASAGRGQPKPQTAPQPAKPQQQQQQNPRGQAGPSGDAPQPMSAGHPGQPKPQSAPQAAALQPAKGPQLVASAPTPAAAPQAAAQQPAAKGPKSRNKYAKKVEEPVQELARTLSVTSIASSTGSAPAPPPSGDASAAASAPPAAPIPTSAEMTVTPFKGAGTCGRKIQLDTNYLELNIDKLVPSIYHYDVNIEPNMPKRFMPLVFEKFRRANFPTTFIAFDGQKNAYAPKMLNLNDIKERKVMHQDEESAAPRAYMVGMKEVKTSNPIDMKALQTYNKTRQYDKPARALQAIEIILKAVFLNAKGVGVGRAFYKPLLENNRPFDLGDNFDLWTGLFQSTVLGSIPYLNVDIAHKAFPRAIPLLDLMANMRCDPSRGMDPRSTDALRTHMRGLRISYVVPGHPQTLKSYKFNDFRDPPSQHKFKNDKDQMVTITAYMAATYKVNLRFPNLPSVWVGAPDRKIYLPLEFCSIAANQAVMRKCTEMQTRNMIKVAATSTDVRRKKIMDLLRTINHNACPTLQQFGVNVATEFATIAARVLNPPQLEYAQKKSVTPAKGVWNASGYFLFPVTLSNWAVLTLDQRAHENDVRTFVERVSTIGANYNMQISNQPQFVRLRPGFRDGDIDREMQALKANDCKLLFCIISNFGDNYARVKQAAEIRCGILTQCIKEATLTRKCTDVSTISNILLKVNAKLNGTNHKLSDVTKLPIQRRPHMVIGADVTHPSPEQTRIPSVVGVAFSYDAQSFRYRMCWRLQNPKQEMIQDLDEMLIEQLNLFQAANKVLPEYLFYYRDGVSEGQFQEVMRVELLAIYRGCARVKDQYKPKVVFVVVQKRHHTRFFPKVPNRADRNNNVEPGTIVDTQITHPNETQFFLVSHASIQGVAKPTKYCLLRDDANMNINDLETFTYNLCHLFTRCNRAVSYPAPTYYAHLAAYRGRVYIEGKPINMDKLDKEYNDRRTSVFITRDNPMYFV